MQESVIAAAIVLAHWKCKFALHMQNCCYSLACAVAFGCSVLLLFLLLLRCWSLKQLKLVRAVYRYRFVLHGAF